MNKPHPLGPTPWRPSKETDEPPAGRVLAALAEHVHPVTTAELVSQLGLHPNTVRSHLQELVDVGMVARETVPPAGRGRPAHRYRITDEGRAVPTVSDPAFAEYRGLTTAFASYLAARSAEPSAEARQIGRAWGAQLAESDPTSRPGDTATRRVTRLLSKLGFSPVPGPSPADGLALRTCPLLELATEMPEVICQVHRGLVEGALVSYGADRTTVDLRAFSEPGACRLYLGEAATT
ncbi:MAG TPA: helix-turn-helix domain-containing protein [Ornithinicoccus sp.]|nr:helix-turn-helix domain-containing protein [Ornithinicoccus sp.]